MTTYRFRNPPQALIFDLFGVVIAFNEESVYTRLAAHCPNPGRALLGFEGLVSTPELISGNLSLRELHGQLVVQHGLLLEFEAFRQEWLTLYTSPMPGMAELLGQLRSAYRLVLLSNVDRDYLQVVRSNHRELENFAVQVVSCETGHAKPAAAAFAAGIHAAGVAPGACYFIDDKPENIQAAANLGIPGHAFTTALKLRAAFAAAGILTGVASAA